MVALATGTSVPSRPVAAPPPVDAPQVAAAPVAAAPVAAAPATLAEPPATLAEPPASERTSQPPPSEPSIAPAPLAPRPPISLTSAPAHAYTTPAASARSAAEASPIPSRAKPLLASEALMEDLAPVEPARRDARTWCAACGIAFLVFGTLPILGLLPGGLGAAVPWLVTGAISLVAGAARVNYRQRAVAMLVLGMLTGVVALQASDGAALHADGGPAWGLSRLFAAVSLAAALQFRARYRAYAGARVFLGTALTISVPFVVHIALHLTREGGFGPAHLGAIIVLLAVTASLTGFMGAETTGAGAYMGPIIVSAFALDLALSGLATVGPSAGLAVLLSLAVGSAGFGAAAGFTGLGLFQILAWRFSADARRIDLHSPKPERRPANQDPPSDWSTRD